MLNDLQLHDKTAPGITFVSADDLKEWYMDIEVLDDNPIYKGEKYRLKFMFSNNYPIGMLDTDTKAFKYAITDEQRRGT